MTEVPIRDAATIILVRDESPGSPPQVLMGQRGAKAAFMPNKFVFPGGAVDTADADISLADPLPEPCAGRLSEAAAPALAPALPVAAIRELWEETGLVLGTKSQWPRPPTDWRGFAATGHRPSARGLRFVFRAITPPGRPRRFDARFFLANTTDVAGDPDDFSAASDELSHLQWVPLPEVRQFDLPFITEVVLAEVAELIATPGAPKTVPFFRNDDEQSLFLRLGASPLRPAR